VMRVVQQIRLNLRRDDFDLSYAIKERGRCYVYNIPSRELAQRIRHILEHKPERPDMIARYCPNCGSHEGCKCDR
jgi:hypothetical protein